MTRGLAPIPWKERFSILLRVLYPNRFLKLLPPEFTLRDPVLSLINRTRSQGRRCAVLLFCHAEEGERDFLAAGLSTRGLRSLFAGILSGQFQREDILGVRRYGEDSYTVFVRMASHSDYGELQHVTGRIRSQLERHWRGEAGSKWERQVNLHAGCHFIDPLPANTREAVGAAVRCAYALATKRLPAQYATFRQDLANIVNTEAITVYTQPIMNLESGELFGWEVLSRGPVDSPFHSPVDLFGFAQQAGLLVPMEFLVIRKALREIFRQDIREQVFINVTPVTLAQPLLLERMLEWMRQYPRVSPRQIVLEITEQHSIHNFRQMAGILAAYRSHGFRIAIDDAGYASWQTLTELIPDIIKIDKSVIRNIDRMAVKESLLKALLAFADNIQCQVIAEGVEREEEAEVLCRNRVPMGQGFFFSHPQPVQAVYPKLHFDNLKEKIMRLRYANGAHAEFNSPL